ncbi:hypothetical protein ACQPZG_25015 [Streptomyces sp. CA-294286]|uniref:hypothetical protein n=1 Tax=Streptomyces sp. CA-294286 TaxID=3240070 RepID=UPI003D8D5653
MRKRVAVWIPALAALLLTAGCGAPDVPPEATGTLEELAAKAGCVPEPGTSSAEIRQANCRSSDGNYLLATFATDRGRQEWLDSADDYGGSYLVGRKWVAVGDEAVLTALRGRLGGSVAKGESHSGDGEEGPADHGGHTSHTRHTGLAGMPTTPPAR